MGAKVLVVDDEQDFTDLLLHGLSRGAYEVVTARGGIEALHKARRYLPDVVLLDLVLPDLDGLAVCDILRNQPSTADIPIIVVTAQDGESVRQSAVSSGVVTVLTKPVDMNQVRETVAYALSLRRDGSSAERSEEQSRI